MNFVEQVDKILVVNWMEDFRYIFFLWLSWWYDDGIEVEYYEDLLRRLCWSSWIITEWIYHETYKTYVRSRLEAD